MSDTELTPGRRWFELPETVRLPKWAPPAIIIAGDITSVLLAVLALYGVGRVISGVALSSLPWWGKAMVYSGISGAAFRASREAKRVWSAYWNRHGVFVRWARSLH
jgi:hypothetical protein